MPSLNDSLSQAAKNPPPAPLKDDQVQLVDVDLIDENPHQQRRQVDEEELLELMGTIGQQGLQQPIVVLAKSGGRFVLIIGQRRLLAYKRLRDAATDETTKKKWSSIKATVRIGLSEAEAAELTVIENIQRVDVSPVEEGLSYDNLIQLGVATTNEELAKRLSKEPLRIQRCRRIAKAPKVVRDAIDVGLSVVVGKDEEGREKKERRKLDLMTGLEFAKLHEFLFKEKPKKADERTDSAIRRALAQKWSLRRTEEFVRDVRAKKTTAEESGSDSTASEPSTPPVAPVFERTPRRFIVDLSKLAGATEEQLSEAKAAFAEIIATRGAGSISGGHHQ